MRGDARPPAGQWAVRGGGCGSDELVQRAAQRAAQLLAASWLGGLGTAGVYGRCASQATCSVGRGLMLTVLLKGSMAENTAYTQARKESMASKTWSGQQATDSRQQAMGSGQHGAAAAAASHLRHHGEGGARLPLVLHRPHKGHAQVARLAAVLLGCRGQREGKVRRRTRRQQGLRAVAEQVNSHCPVVTCKQRSCSSCRMH